MKAEKKSLELHQKQLQDLSTTTTSLEQRLAEQSTADTMRA